MGTMKHVANLDLESLLYLGKCILR